MHDAITAISTPAANGQSAVKGIALLDESGARKKRFAALAIMIIPFFGTVEAARLLWIGQFTAIDGVLFAVMYFLHMGGITMGFHRLLAHRAFRTSAFFRGFLMICGSMAGQGPVMFWITTHRRHHAYSDQTGDPHSPNLHGRGLSGKLKGLWYAHMPWMLSPETSTWNHFAMDVLRDRSVFFFNQTYTLWLLLGLLVPALIGGLATSSLAGAWSGFIFGGLARMFIANQAAWCVGSVCHRYGGKQFATGDHSANNWLVAFFTFGEGLQNNHHAFSSWYRHGVHWWEPDLSGWVLALLGKLGIVWELRSPTREAIANARLRRDDVPIAR